MRFLETKMPSTKRLLRVLALGVDTVLALVRDIPPRQQPGASAVSAVVVHEPHVRAVAEARPAENLQLRCALVERVGEEGRCSFAVVLGKVHKRYVGRRLVTDHDVRSVVRCVDQSDCSHRQEGKYSNS